MKLRSARPQDIKVPEVRVTSDFDSEALAMFKESIKALGILEPPVCVEVDGELVLVDGLHRVVEAIENKTKRLQVVVMDGDMKQVLLKNVALNNLRGTTPPTQIARVFEELQREYQMDTGEIARETGFTRDYVEKLIWIGRAHPRVLEELDKGTIRVGHAFALSRIPDTERQERVLMQELMYRFTVPQLEEHIKAVESSVVAKVSQPPPTKPTAAPTFPCHFCGGQYDGNMIQNPNICPSCAGILIGAQQMARLDLAESTSPVEDKVEPW